MDSAGKDNILNKLISLLSTHQRFKLKHIDTESEKLTEERWMDINKCADKLIWLYGGHFMTDKVDKELITGCCKMFFADENNFKTKNRKKEIVYARAFYAKFLFQNGQSHDDIAIKIHRKRSNVYNVLKTADNLISTDKAMKEKFEVITEKFKIEEVDAL